MDVCCLTSIYLLWKLNTSKAQDLVDPPLLDDFLNQVRGEKYLLLGLNGLH